MQVSNGSPIIGIILGLGFLLGSAVLLFIGFRLRMTQRDTGSVEVDAECIGISKDSKNFSYFNGEHQNMTWNNQLTPTYHYSYNGQEYTSSPMLSSNRPGYHPQLGSCRIRINPDHPEKVYSSENKWVSAMLIFIGACSAAGGIFALVISILAL